MRISDLKMEMGGENKNEGKNERSVNGARAGDAGVEAFKAG